MVHALVSLHHSIKAMTELVLPVCCKDALPKARCAEVCSHSKRMQKNEGAEAAAAVRLI